MRKHIYFILLLIVALLFSACVPTPEEEAIVQKDQQQMLHQAQVTDSDGITETNLYERLKAPQHYEKSMSANEGRLKVTVDADVMLPNVELPIIRMNPIDFPRNQFLKLANALVPEDSKFVDWEFTTMVNWREAGFMEYAQGEEDEVEDVVPINLKSKGYYEREIQRLRWAIDHWNDGGEVLYDLKYYTPEEAEQGLLRLLVEQNLAPKSLPVIELNAMHDPGGELFYATSDDMHYSQISISNQRASYGFAQISYNRDILFNTLTDDNVSVPFTDFTLAEAQTYLDSFLERVPFEGFICTAAFPFMVRNEYEQDVHCYHFILTRDFNGVSETPTSFMQALDAYNKDWGYEMIHIIIDADGIAGFRYRYPYTVGETVVERTNLLPFSEIEKVFKKRITVYRNNLMEPTFENSSKEYVITGIRLGLVNIKEENTETGLLVPCWDFMGYIRYWDVDGESANYTNELYSFLCINAVDGSIINRGGY